MADLNPLIRLRRYTVEEKQKILSALYREVENLVQKRRALADQLEKEKELARQDVNPDAITLFGRYAENVRTKLAHFDDTIKKMEVRIDVAQEDVRAAFAEMKKVQIIKRRRDEREQQAIKDKETAELNEIAIEGFRRKEDIFE